MKRFVTMITGLLAVAALAGTASAALRVPQVPVLGGSLQGYLNTADGGINAATDQNAAQRWAATVSNNSTFTVQVELAGNAASNNIGLYNASAGAPALYQVFPGAAAAGWFAVASFRNAPVRVVVNLFDANAALQGTTSYLGADRNDFGYYLSGPGGTFYTQDSRNPGSAAQALTYAGTGLNSGSWFLCFEDVPLAGSDQDYDDAVLFLESVNPTPVAKTSWSNLKTRFR
jgi:hypothetical protein